MKSGEVKLKVGDCIMEALSKEKHENSHACTIVHTLYIVTVTETNAEVCLVDDPTAELIFVSLDREKPCYPQLPDVSWTKPKGRKNSSNTTNQSIGRESRGSYRATGLITRSQSKQLNSMS